MNSATSFVVRREADAVRPGEAAHQRLRVGALRVVADEATDRVPRRADDHISGRARGDLDPQREMLVANGNELEIGPELDAIAAGLGRVATAPEDAAPITWQMRQIVLTGN